MKLMFITLFLNLKMLHLKIFITKVFKNFKWAVKFLSGYTLGILVPCSSHSEKYLHHLLPRIFFFSPDSTPVKKYLMSY